MKKFFFQKIETNAADWVNFSYFYDENTIEKKLIDFQTNSFSYNFAFVGTKIPKKLSYKVPFFRILYVMKGAIKLTLDRKRIPCNEGSFIIANPYTYILYQEQTENTEVLTLCFKNSFFSKNVIDSMRNYPLFYNFFQAALHSKFDKSNYLFFETPICEYRLFLVLQILMAVTNDDYNQALCESSFILLIARLHGVIDEFLNIRNTSMENHILVGDIIRYTRANFQNISLEKLSKIYYIHPNYLSALIRKETGMTFSEHITNIRMTRAIDFLLNTNLKIEDISHELGYSDKTYFYRSFKEVYQTSPSKYRKYAHKLEHN
ncbi:AraC family transcriptional regulator [Liquorilactobacillus uvarum]|uniref:HTH araC/xylS-type domain-containing protein n=1 Tax=Liquorilactobacillus uvarum DSM 19971 TaxID=1423812 RepID=A0A0R1Q075_9LACO|nr:AraC family transcriptional regulator [Liquorilactobacillus uvarum]KRL38135.1 hypothetical protein FD20_GL002083 [Liquorilactobacillus uvarum DSM 19971]